MRILLDECIDRRFALELPDHDVATAAEMNWLGLKNGELLERAHEEFEAFVTVDRNLSFQQDLARFDVAVLVLRAPTNRLEDLRRLVRPLLEILPAAQTGAATIVERPAAS